MLLVRDVWDSRPQMRGVTNEPTRMPQCSERPPRCSRHARSRTLGEARWERLEPCNRSDWLNVRANRIRCLVYENGETTPVATAFLDQPPRSERLASSLDPVVYEQDAIRRSDRSALQDELQLVAAPVTGSSNHCFRPWVDCALLADRGKTDAHLQRDCYSKDEAAGFDSATFVTPAASNGEASASDACARKAPSENSPKTSA
jgi:hypothetical protein